MGATSDARFCCGKLGRRFWRRCTAKLPVPRQVRARPCPDGVYSHRRGWLFKTPYAEEIPGSSNSRWLRRGTTATAVAIIVTPIRSARPHTRTGGRGGTRIRARSIRIQRFKSSWFKLSPEPGIRLTVFPLSRTPRPRPRVPSLYLILSLGPSTLLRARRWDALRAHLPLFRCCRFHLYQRDPIQRDRHQTRDEIDLRNAVTVTGCGVHCSVRVEGGPIPLVRTPVPARKARDRFGLICWPFVSLNLNPMSFVDFYLRA